MLKWLFHRRLNAFEREHGYDASYMHAVIDTDVRGFVKFARATGLGRYRKDVPADVYVAATLTSSIQADCGPCTQLGVGFALRAGAGRDSARLTRGTARASVAPMKRALVMVRGNTGSLVSTLAGLALSFAAAGCGSDGGTCGVAPCGGDVVGTWQARSSCVDKATLDMEFLAGIMGSCPDASLGNVSVTPNGSIAFTADMMVTSTLSLSSTLDIIFPATCTSGVSCADLTTVLQTLVGSGGITSVNCTGSSGCTCRLAQASDTVDETGTWATSGTTLTVTGATTGADDGPYCVQGSSLHLLEFDSGGMMKVVSDIILSKQ